MKSDPIAPPLAVVVVEDERDLRDEVVEYLATHDLSVRAAATGAELDRLLDECPADAVVLDLGLPGEDGVAIARRLRQRSPATGIVMMTARARVEERILGYETGADVYLVKPVDFGELIAAIRATVRHRGAVPSSGAGNLRQPPLAWRLELTSWRLVAPSGASVRLTRAETQALACLTEEPGKPVSREVIGQRMGKVADQLGEHRYVDQIISRLRRKITAELGWEPPIGAAHGQGYHTVGPVVRVEV